jgi:3',5'-nucleoside bisphosphate phosphatase
VDHPRARVPALSAGADLHLHSTASDGALAPAEVVRRAAAAGLAALALTDHDSVAGLAEAGPEAARAGLELLPGVEVAVRAPWGEMHLLLYGEGLGHPVLQGALDRARAERAARGEAMVACLNRLGVAVSVAEVEAQAAGAPVGRPHVARALVAAGTVRTLEEAFDRFLGRGRPAYVPRPLPPLTEVASLVRRIGAVASAAHLGARASRALLAAFAADGLDAVEVHHPSHSAAQRAQLERWAGELGLLRTGGSDWHGAPGVGPSHATVGSERVPLAWVERIRALSRDRLPPPGPGPA